MDNERWLAGAARSVEETGLGTHKEITNENLKTLKDDELIGSVLQVHTHVAMISKVNRDSDGNIISFETQNANTRASKEGKADGSNHGLGTDSVDVNLKEALAEGRVFIGIFNSDVLRRAGQKQGQQIATELANRTTRTSTA